MVLPPSPLQDRTVPVKRITATAETQEAVCGVIVADYLDDFSEIYATTIAITEIHPEQANNQIRNALTHLARALTSQDATAIRDNLEKAGSHIERGKRDCIKTAIALLKDRISSTLYRIEHEHGLIPRSIKDRLRIIEAKRKSAYKNEAKGDISVSGEMEDILADLLELEESLFETFHIPGKVIFFLKRWLLITLKNIRITFYAVSVGCLSSYLVLVNFENSTEAKTFAIKIWSSTLVFIKSLF
ncbi:MAG: hypothetical protein HQL75_17860 [Magnetococcales bacterium]|nr:hypothetical protein [Magnetococcales bacterium]